MNFMGTLHKSLVKEMQRMGATAGNFVSDTDELLFIQRYTEVNECHYRGAKIIYMQWVNRKEQYASTLIQQSC